MQSQIVVSVVLTSEKRCLLGLPQDIATNLILSEDVPRPKAIHVNWTDVEGEVKVAFLGWGNPSSTPGDVIEVPAEMASCLSLYEGAQVHRKFHM